MDPSSEEQEGRAFEDSTWPVAVNVVSLGVIVATNTLMLLQMAEKISYRLAAPRVILGWYVSAFLLIGLAAAAPGHCQLPPSDPRTFSQAYYYGAMAGGIYCCVATMLGVTAFGVFKSGYARKFKLTTAQKTLMLETITFLGYPLCGRSVRQNRRLDFPQ